MSGKAAAEPAQQSGGTPKHDTAKVAGHHGQVGEKRSRQQDASMSPSRDASRSPIRSPSRHKHSKKHKKEHSHKKSKRDKHDAVDRPDDASELSELVPTSVAAVANGTQADAADDLQALRQAALQTTKPVAVAGTDAVTDSVVEPVVGQVDCMQPEQDATV